MLCMLNPHWVWANFPNGGHPVKAHIVRLCTNSGHWFYKEKTHIAAWTVVVVVVVAVAVVWLWLWLWLWLYNAVCNLIYD